MIVTCRDSRGNNRNIMLLDVALLVAMCYLHNIAPIQSRVRQLAMSNLPWSPKNVAVSHFRYRFRQQWHSQPEQKSACYRPDV